MISKVTCPSCKGNKVVAVKLTSGSEQHRPCPACNGAGYQVKVGRPCA